LNDLIGQRSDCLLIGHYFHRNFTRKCQTFSKYAFLYKK